MADMLIYLIVATFIVGLVNGIAGIAIKIQVNRSLPEGERFSWWNRFNYFEVQSKHRELFPGSFLPGVAQFSLVISLFLFAAIILTLMKAREHGNSF
ncbi:MAG: hypothetical protein ABR987_17610 [Terracidiphilus sp.]